jgi:hypothetical protein
VADVYFAAAPSNEIGARLAAKARDHHERSRSSGRLQKIIKSHALSVGATVNDTGAVAWGLVTGGEQGELVHSVENHYRALGNNVINLTTAERPTIQCSAANRDVASLDASMLADGLLDYYLARRGVEVLLKRACKRGVYQSEGFIYVPWDPSAGEPHMPVMDEETGEVTGQTKTGDVGFHCLGPLDVVRDEWAESWETLNWVMVRLWVSKYDLIARYPELATEIEGMGVKSESYRIGFGARCEDTDLIECWEFFHKKTDSMPDGRMVSFLSADVVLYDGPTPYSDLPVYPLFPDELDGTPFGDTPMFDLMGPQDAINGIDTAVITNQLGRGIGNLLVPDGADVSVDQLAGSMNAITYKGEKEPSPLEYPPVPSDLYQSKKDKVAAMEMLSGVSSVTRGAPNESVGADSSGAKLALIDAKSIQNNSGLEKSYVGLVRNVCLAILHRLRDFGGDVQRQAKLVGKNNQHMLREFVGADLDGIDLVKVEMGNPVLRTTSGKMAIADKAVELGVIKPGQLDKYMLLLRTGQDGPLYEVETQIQMRIRGENESMMDGSGEPHLACILDPHWREINEHASLLDNVAARGRSPEAQALQQRVLAAIQEHIDLLLQMPPLLVLSRGGPEAMAFYQQAQAMIAPPPMPGQPGASTTPPPAPGSPSSTSPPESGASDATNPNGSKPQQAGMPQMAQQPNGAPAMNPGVETMQ